jgi:hypothetical protein
MLPAEDQTSVVDESAIAALDAAASTPAFDPDLLRIPAAADMRRQIALVVGLLEKLDHGKLLRKQNPISRLVGADVEARLEFELASERVLDAVSQLRIAAQNARRLSAKLATASREIATEQQRLETVIADGKLLLDTAVAGDEFHRARFERRLSNIMALHAANQLTVQQIALASRVITSLFDRFTDVETLLLPVWQRQSMALATAVGTDARHAAKDFSTTNVALIDFLKQDVNSS